MSFLDSIGSAAGKVSQGVDKFMQSPTMTRIRAGADLASRVMGQQPQDPNDRGLNGIRNDLSYLRTGTMALRPLNPNQPLRRPTSIQGNPMPAAPQGDQGLYGVL